jgi:hypothetical protein
MPGIFRPDFRVPPQQWIPTLETVASPTITVTAGSVLWSGQTVTVSLTTPITAGSVTWSGQTVTVTIVSVSLIYDLMSPPVLVW